MDKRKQNKDRKLVQAFLPGDLYKRFQASAWRRQFLSDGEAIRAMLRGMLKQEDQGNETAQAS